MRTRRIDVILRSELEERWKGLAHLQGKPVASALQCLLTIWLMNSGRPPIDRFNDLVTELLNSGFL